MHTPPLFGNRPLWYQCLLLAMLVAIFLVFSSLLTLVVPLLYHIPTNDLVTGQSTNPRFTDAIRWTQVIAAIGVMLVPAFLYARLTQVEPRDYLGLRPANTGLFYPLAVVVIIASIPMVQVLASWNQRLHLPHSMSGLDRWIRDTEEGNDSMIDRILTMHSRLDLLANLFVMAVLPGFCEEILFRGILQNLFIKMTRNPVAGILLGAILFSAIHGQFLGFFSRVALGVVLGCLFWYSKSLWPAILAHFLYNGVQVVYFYFQQRQDNAHLSPFFDDKAVMPLAYGLISAVIVVAGLLWMRRLSARPLPSDKTTVWPYT
jgi:uncharacterized protein